jgi:aerotaxis receptor
MLLSVVSLFVAGAVQLYRQRQAMRETLAEHPKAFTSALVALTYTDRRGAQALLDMAMISEEARMQTALTRLEDVAEGVRRRAAESARLATAEADLLDQQRSETDQSATAITEMATTIQEVAHNVQHTSHAAEEADQLARQGRDLVGGSVESMLQMARAVHDIGQAVNELASATQSIGSVADVITSIAEQTNLLALNAAIEAARASRGVVLRWWPTRYVPWRHVPVSLPSRSSRSLLRCVRGLSVPCRPPGVARQFRVTVSVASSRCVRH